MRIIPAIDIIDGKCVRLSQGDYSTKKIYNESPLEVAKQFEDFGINYLHLVDLDGAKARTIVNSKVLENICNQTGLSVDFGGGIKSHDDILKAFDCGAKQVTAGSIAVSDPAQVFDWITEFGSEKIILGADVNESEVMINGWQKGSGQNITTFISKFQEQGIISLISTDIATDGMLSGPSIKLYEQLISDFPEMNVIASGGVSSTSDLDDLIVVGVEGVIIGKAIYESKISLNELSNYVN
jgi:phosphoribosylformimino-5-aminoimidazole carboxamide ribotide isomerase